MMSEEIIDTTKGQLTAKLWHVDAYVIMKFNNNFHAPIHGKKDIEILREALSDIGVKYYAKCDDCNFSIEQDTDGLCVLSYSENYHDIFHTSVKLAKTGLKRLIEILDAAIAQAFTPKQIMEFERQTKEWEQSKRK